MGGLRTDPTIPPRSEHPMTDLDRGLTFRAAHSPGFVPPTADQRPGPPRSRAHPSRPPACRRRPPTRGAGIGGSARSSRSSLLSAVLAAGGTAALVAGTARRLGRRSRQHRRQRPRPASPPRPGTAPTASPADLPTVVAAVRDSVVTITSEGFSSRGLMQHPVDRRRLRDRPHRRRLHPDQQARRRRAASR